MALNETRRLGTDSGRIRREARRVERAGGNPTGLLNAAAEQKLNEGSAISSAEGNARRDEFSRRLQQGLMRQQLMGATQPGAAPAARSLATPTAAPSLSSPRTSAPRMPSLTTDSGIPNSIRRPGGEGRINGQPASSVLSSMRENPQYEPSFGGQMAKDNLASKGLEGAVSDYQRRASADNAAGAQTVAQAGQVQSALQRSIAASRERRAPVMPEPAATEPRPDSPLTGVAGTGRSLAPSTPTTEIAGPPAPVAPASPSTFSEAFSRDLGSLRRGAGQGLSRAGSALNSAGRSFARGSERVRNFVADEAVNSATAPARAFADFVPGETGELVRRRMNQGNQTFQRGVRGILSPRNISLR